MRKSIAIAAASLMMFTQVAGAIAATDSTNIINSGSNANVNTSATENTNVAVTNTNTAVVSQTSVSHNNTGDNEANGNISLGPCGTCLTSGPGTSIQTGNAASSNTQTVTANTNTTGISLPSAPVSNNSTGVVNTGSHLNVNTSATTNTNVAVSNTNSAYVSQTSVADNNTGDNEANHNIGEVGIVTGNAGSQSSQSVDVDHNTTVIVAPSPMPLGCGFSCGCDTGCGSCLGGNCTDVTNTGKHLNVNTTAVTNTNIAVWNSNKLLAHQTVLADNNTGDNEANHNIGGAGILTGNAGSAASEDIMGNTNDTGIGLWGLGLPMGTNMFSVVNTGASATLNASATANDNVATTNSNFLLGWQTTLSSNSSGYNESSKNIGGAWTSTGFAGSLGSTGLGPVNGNTTFIGSLFPFMSWLSLWLL